MATTTQSDDVIFEHWIFEIEKPEGDPTCSDVIIRSFIKTLAIVIGSEEEARMSIYSVSTRHIFAFKARVSEELAYKIKELPKVLFVAPDFYFDINIYQARPFVGGRAAACDPWYYEPYEAEVDVNRPNLRVAPSSNIGGPGPSNHLSTGCNSERWHVVMKIPDGLPTREEVIDSYIKIVATVMGSEEEASMRIYSVSAKFYYAFGVIVSKQLAYKITRFANVKIVVPDLDYDDPSPRFAFKKGEPFINGQAVPYDPKYYVSLEKRVGFFPPYYNKNR